MIIPWVITWSNIINIKQEKKIVYATYKMKVRCLIFRLGQWETFVCDMHICIDMAVEDDRNKWFPTCKFTDILFLRNYLCSHYTLCFTLFTSTGAAIFKRNVSPWFPRRCRIRKVPLCKMVWCEPVKGPVRKKIYNSALRKRSGYIF